MPYKNAADKNASFKRWYEKNKAKHIGYVRANGKRYAKQADELKSGPCVDCGGVFPPCAMDWDHVRGEKIGNIAKMRTDGTMKKLKEEIKKCDLVCANCHRIRTHNRKTGN